MLPSSLRNFADSICCSCVIDDQSMNDDGRFVTFPRKIGASFLLYGRRKSHFPYHCSVGPDWIMVVLVFILIFTINGVILYVVSPLGWPPVLIGGIGALGLLWTYCSVAFTDPGTVYKNDYTNLISISNDVEDPMHEHSHAQEQKSGRAATNPPPNTMDCGQCQFKRPMSARHCTFCKSCIDHLDHHCPW